MSDFIKWLYTNYIKPHLDTIPKGEGKNRSFGLFFALLLLKHPAGGGLMRPPVLRDCPAMWGHQ